LFSWVGGSEDRGPRTEDYVVVVGGGAVVSVFDFSGGGGGAVSTVGGVVLDAGGGGVPSTLVEVVSVRGVGRGFGRGGASRG
jgi:hypothetical protein